MTGRKQKVATAKPRGVRAPTVNLTLRLPSSLLDKLRRDAEANERSIAAEAQRRLQQNEISDIAKMVGKAIETVELRAGKSWAEDDAVASTCRLAGEAVLSGLLGMPISPTASLDGLKAELKIIEGVVADGLSFDRADRPAILAIEKKRRAIEKSVQQLKEAFDAVDVVVNDLRERFKDARQ